jgi:Ulp1 family protease
MNKHAAISLYNALSPLLSSSKQFKLIESDGDAAGGGAGCFCPQQENGYDCGVMVLAIAEILCERFVNEKNYINFQIDPKEVGARELNTKRQAMHALVLDKALERQQQNQT